MAETIPKLITDVEKYFQYEGSANPTTQDELQAFMKNEHSVVACLAKKLWQPETNYTQGQIVESPNMPVGFYAVALVNGTSYSNEPDWGNGSTDISDGSIKWHMTKGNITVNGVAPDSSGNVQIDSINHADNADNAIKATNDSKGQDITGYVKNVSGNNNSLVITDGNGKESTINIATDANPFTKNINVTASTQGYRVIKQTNGFDVNIADITKSTGAGSSIRYYREFRTNTGLEAGTYTLKNLLQQLVNRSHTHTTYKETQKYYSNCCSGDSDS